VALVDNCSQDASVAVINDWLTAHDRAKAVTLIESAVNGGFSAGNNIGIKGFDADYYLLLNSDTIVRPDAIRILLQTADGNVEAGIVSPRLEWPDSVPQESCFRYLSPVSELIDAARTGVVTAALKAFDVPIPATDTMLHPQWTSFACVLVRHEVVSDIGLMDEGYFMYFDDVDYCMRARKAGWNVLYNPNARVVHLRGGSSPVKQRTLERKRLPRYYYASRTRYFFLAYGWLGLTLANLLWSVGRLISKSREIIGRRGRDVPDKQWRDIWTNWLRPGTPWPLPKQN
jgi:hypothetical protein